MGHLLKSTLPIHILMGVFRLFAFMIIIDPLGPSLTFPYGLRFVLCLTVLFHPGLSVGSSRSSFSFYYNFS